MSVIGHGVEIVTSGTRPASPFDGMQIYETDTNKVLVYNGSSWVEVNDLDNPGGLSTFAYTPPMCRVYRSSSLTGYTSNTQITWNAEDFDTDSMWTSGATMTVNTPGIYLVTFSGLFVATATLSVVAPGIVKNGSPKRIIYTTVTPTAAYFNVCEPIKFIANDTISASVEFVGGSSHYLEGNADVDNQITTRLSAIWIGST